MRFIFLLVAFGTTLITNGQKAINIHEVSKHIGDSVKVCGQVYDTYFAGRTESTPTFLNIGAKYPNQLLTVVIWNDVRKEFEKAPEELFKDKTVCIMGRLELYKEKPQIAIHKSSQIIIN
jgi:hypothetical protein